MNVLITGINGTIGRTIARVLFEHFFILGVGREENCLHKYYHYYFTGDITDENFVCGIMKVHIKIELVIHCAAAIYGPYEKLFLVNCYGMQNIIHLCKSVCPHKVIYISSIPIVGSNCDDVITEDTAVCPNSVYHYTKYFAEVLLKQLDGIIDTYILRIASPLSVYLPKEKIVPSFITKCIRNDDIFVNGVGTRIQNYIDVRDIGSAIFKVIETKKNGGLYNLSGTNISNYELAKLCVYVLKSKSSVVLENKKNDLDDVKWIVSGEKAKVLLGIKQNITLEQSILNIREALENIDANNNFF